MRCDKIPMVGKRYGDVVVLAEAPWKHYPTSKPHRRVVVRCDCGTVYETDAAQLRRGDSKRCRECGREHSADHHRYETSVRLPDGRTIAQIAAASGLKLGTVYRRFLRGWPPEYLGMALRPRRGYGGSIDLPERRRTVYPESRS